jgi:hypothetical protein
MNEQLPAKTPTSARVVTWDFSADTSATLSSPSVAKSLIAGPDPSAAGLTVSAPLISGQTVYVLVSNGVDDCSYELLCTVSDSTAQVYQSGARITTTTAAA